MRISDWSSDVCSSDLKRVRGHSMPGLWRPFRSLAPCFPSSMPCRHRHRARGPVDVRLAAGALAMKSQHVKPVAACDIGRSDKGRNISNVTPQPLDDVSFKQELAAMLPHLRAFGRSLCGNADLADDLVPETMMTRSEERRVGKECVSTCRYRWAPE